MKILIPVHYFTDDPQSGLNTELWNFPTNLAKLGHEIFVVATASDLTRETRQSLREKGIRLYTIYSHKKHGLGEAEALMTFLFSLLLRIRYRFDWIFVPDAAKTPFSRFKLGAKFAGRFFTPETEEMKEFFNSGDWYFDRTHKDESEGIEGRRDPFVYRVFQFLANRVWFRLFPVTRIAENADILFAQGMEPLHYARSVGWKNPVYLPNVVQADWFDAHHGELVDTNGKFVFLFIGRILKSKGIFNLLPVFKKLVEQHPNIELWVVGPSHGLYTDLLNEAVQGLEDKVKILGPKNHQEIATLIRSCDVVVDPFIYASFSTVALEALYCKKPIIAPRMGDTKDVVKEGKTGYLADSRDPDELMRKMEHCIINADDAQRLAEAGYEMVRQHVTCERIARVIDENFRYYSDAEKIARINREFESYFA